MKKLDNNVEEALERTYTVRDYTSLTTNEITLKQVFIDIEMNRVHDLDENSYYYEVQEDYYNTIKQHIALQQREIDNNNIMRKLLKKKYDNRIKEEVVIEGNQNVQEKNHKLQAKIKELKEDNRNINWAYNMQREIIEKHNSKLDKIRELIYYIPNDIHDIKTISVDEIKAILEEEIE